VSGVVVNPTAALKRVLNVHLGVRAQRTCLPGGRQEKLCVMATTAADGTRKIFETFYSLDLPLRWDGKGEFFLLFEN